MESNPDQVGCWRDQLLRITPWIYESGVVEEANWSNIVGGSIFQLICT
jgi:hypothetical protein